MPTKQIKIPKDRAVKKSIRLNNGIITYEVGRKFYNGHFDEDATGHWYRNGKIITENQLKKYSFIDKDGSEKALSSEGIVYGKQALRLRNKAYEYSNKFKNYGNNKGGNYKGNLITLKTNGRMNLTTIPTNMLDSILVSSGRSNTPVRQNLGLVGKESTFNSASIPLHAAQLRKTLNIPQKEAVAIAEEDLKDWIWDKHGITNNHAYYFNPYYAYFDAIRNTGRNPWSGEKNIEDDIKYALDHKLVEKNATPVYYPSDILADAFIRYDKNPKGYNSGQGNYTTMVDNIGNEVYNEPQIQAYINSMHGQEMLKKGKRERTTLSGKY